MTLNIDKDFDWLRHRFNDVKTRCNNPNFKHYKYYGGRGIRCLFRDTEHFVNYCSTLPNCSPEYEIDRIDNNGDYCEGNIRFVTRQENMSNRRNLFDKPDNDVFKTFCKLRLEGLHRYDIERALSLDFYEYQKYESRLQYRADAKGIPLPNNGGTYHKVEEEIKLFARTYNKAPLNKKRGRSSKSRDAKWVMQKLNISWSEYRRLYAKAGNRNLLDN